MFNEQSTRVKQPAGDEPIRVVELVVARLLRAGVAISLMTVAVGILLVTVTGETGYGTFDAEHVQTVIAYQPQPHFPASLREVWGGLLVGKPYAFVSLGLLLLIATPVARVAATFVAFILERDWQYVLITGFVFSMLLISFLLGKVI